MILAQVAVALLAPFPFLSCGCCLFVVEASASTMDPSLAEVNGQGGKEPKPRILGRKKKKRTHRIDFDENRVIGGKSVLDHPAQSFPFFVQTPYCGGTLVSKSVVMSVRSLCCTFQELSASCGDDPKLCRLSDSIVDRYRQATVTTRSKLVT